MTDGDALLAAIIAQPAEDLPRLMYADWLDEHGQPERAEFIRVQCELSRMPHTGGPEEEDGNCATCKMRKPLEDREELLLSRGGDWVGFPYLKPGGARRNTFLTAGETYFRFRRGFVADMSCTSADWLAHADAITAAHPIERVRLTTPLRYGTDRVEWITLVNRECGWMRHWIIGRKKKSLITLPDDATDAQIVQTLLAKMWPRIAFEVPSEPPQPAADTFEQFIAREMSIPISPQAFRYATGYPEPREPR
jgi:uncharacterized protein (TIGR02996 family)